MTQATQSLSAARVAALVEGFDRSPAYAGLADSLVLLIGDGRIASDVRLPSERELTEALGVSRTTVTRAYQQLRDSGYAVARQGAGTFTRVPGGRARTRDRALTPDQLVGDHPDGIDLGCAAPAAPAGLAAAYAEAVAELPAYLGGHGYFPTGLPHLQAEVARGFEARGLPTDPDQVIITPGALSGAAIVAQALARRGDRVLVESPVYPNATLALRNAGGRLVGAPVDPEGWDLAAIGAQLRQVRPALAYLVPDFQNPTGHLMTDAEREEYAGHLRAAGTVAVVDESLQALALDGQEMPRPFAAHSPDAITIGSASKALWGGLRLGWVRAPRGLAEELTRARLSLDLGSPVLEQLVLARLLAGGPVLPDQLVRLREQRAALLEALTEQLPEWRWVRPGGGLAVWCTLPRGSALAIADAAERVGVGLTPGPLFAAEGGLDRFVRIPWTRPAEELRTAVARLAEVWQALPDTPVRPRPGRVLVA
ncbi:PLP-dependent aminotransferase family protein [Nocardioides ginkgobilobae]